MTRIELERILSQAKGPDLEKPFDRDAFYNGSKGVEDILKEASRRKGQEVYLTLSETGRATKFSIHVLAYAIWQDLTLVETHRTFKNGKSTSVKAEGQLVSETHRAGDPYAITICRGVREEMGKVLKKFNIKVEPSHFDFKPLVKVSGKLEKPRESTVYIGWIAQRLVHCAVWDLAQYFDEQPWPEGLEFTDNDGTTIHAQWQPISGALLNAIADARVQAPKRSYAKKIVGKQRSRRRVSRTARLFGS